MKRELSHLTEDQSGATVVLGLFLSLFLTGMVYFAMGVGDAVLYRRIMQDGADAGAFSASVTAAKGMNLHVLLNIAMMSTAAVLLVVRSVEVLLEILIAVLQGLTASIVLAPKALALIATLTPVESTVERIGDAVEQFVRSAHDALDVAHHAVQRGYPLLAEVRAIDAMASQDAYDPPISAGFVVPILGPALPSGGRGLPLAESSLGTLCDRAASGFGTRIARVRSGVPRWLLRFLGGVVEKALRLGKRRTCDPSVVEPPRGVLASRSDGTQVWLGHDEFQYRAFAIGNDPHGDPWSRAERGIRMASGGRVSPRRAAYYAHAVGRLGVSQSEYYFDGTEDKAEWMWRQRWRARLRRFRAPTGSLATSLLDGCRRAVGSTTSATSSSVCDLLSHLPLGGASH